MFVRFIVQQKVSKLTSASGLFVAAEHLKEHGDLSTTDCEQLSTLLEWFRLQLPLPHISFRDGKAVYWYKPSAKQHISKMWELAALLQSHGYHVELVTADFVGLVVYQDEFQVAAVPHTDHHS